METPQEQVVATVVEVVEKKKRAGKRKTEAVVEKKAKKSRPVKKVVNILELEEGENLEFSKLKAYSTDGVNFLFCKDTIEMKFHNALVKGVWDGRKFNKSNQTILLELNDVENDQLVLLESMFDAHVRAEGLGEKRVLKSCMTASDGDLRLSPNKAIEVLNYTELSPDSPEQPPRMEWNEIATSQLFSGKAVCHGGWVSEGSYGLTFRPVYASISQSP